MLKLAKTHSLFVRHRTSHENDERLKIEDGVIQDTSGDVIFKVEFMAIACLPQPDEVLDGRVIDVMATGITVQSGPIKTFISLKKDTSEYLYDQQTNVWVQRDDVVDKKLERNVQVRYRITTLKYINNEFSVVGTIDEDYLGAYNKRTYYTMMRD